MIELIILQKLLHCSITAIWTELEIVERGKVMVEIALNRSSRARPVARCWLSTPARVSTTNLACTTAHVGRASFDAHANAQKFPRSFLQLYIE